MTLIDKACWERGCACQDDREKSESVDVALRNDVLEEVAKAVLNFKAFETDTMDSFAKYVREMKHAKT
jgi:hypothetical protein